MCKKKKKQRVPVLGPHGDPLMPTTPARARKWIKSGKAKPIRDALNQFGVQLKQEPSNRKKQDIVIGVDPGSKFSGVAAVSKNAVLYGANLELPDNVSNKMDKRKERRRNRRYRKTRRRPKRFDNRNGHKIAPSIMSRKKFELRAVRELTKIYPISHIVLEDVSFNHYKYRYGSYFSQVEVGKKWLVKQLEHIAPVTLFRGWETSEKRKEMGLSKSSDKSKRNKNSHINDAIALCSLILDHVNLTNFNFDVARRPKYSRRELHLEQPSKGGVPRRYGGTTTPFIFRKGDYVETKQGNNTVRGWVSGFTKNLVSVSNFEWKRAGQLSINKTHLLNTNNGLLMQSNGGGSVPTKCGFP